MNLSERIRPNCDAAPWVIDEIKTLESFYALAIKERDYERVRFDNLQAQQLEQIEALKLAANINPFGSVENAAARNAAVAAIAKAKGGAA